MRTPTTSAPLSAPAVLAELGGAILGGLLLAIVCGYGLGFLMRGSDLGMGVLTLQVYAGIVGFGVGAGLGAALGGRLLGQGGSWWMAVLGSLLSGALVAVLARLTIIGREIGLIGTLVLALAIAAVGAVAGYNLRRRP